MKARHTKGLLNFCKSFPQKWLQPGLFFVFFAIATVHAHAAVTIFKTAESLSLYAQVGNEYREVATIAPNETLYLEKAAKSYRVQFANNYANLPLETEIGLSGQLDVIPPEKRKTAGYVLLTRDIPLYSESALWLTFQDLLTFKPKVVLKGNIRYPYIGTITTESGRTFYQVLFNRQVHYILKQDVEPDYGIPVITYHHILKDEENKYYTKTSTTTSDTTFEENLKVMKELGFDSLDLYQLEGFLNGSVNTPAKSVVLTFDDGLKSVYRYGYPLLKKYGFKATMFVITSRIKYYEQEWNPNELQFLSRDDYLAMSDLFDWQSHTHFLHAYRNKKALLLQSDERQSRLDFERSLRELKQFNRTPQYLSYPFGKYDERAIRAAKAAGIKLALTTHVGKVKFGDDPYQLKRVYLLRTDNRDKMVRILENQ